MLKRVFIPMALILLVIFISLMAGQHIEANVLHPCAPEWTLGAVTAFIICFIAS